MPVRSTADCQQLEKLKNLAIGALENEKLADAENTFQQVLTLEPVDRLAYRNLAVTRLLGLRSGTSSGEQAEAAAAQLLQHDDSTAAKWLVGRIRVALAEQQPDAAARDESLNRALSLLKQAADGDPTNAAVAYEMFEASRYATSPDLQATARAALLMAAERAPNNLFLMTELLLQQAEQQAPAIGGTLDRIGQIAAPLREGIQRRTRVDIGQLAADATAAVGQSDWRTVLAKSRQLSAVIRPEDWTQSDRRQLSPHPLEFVLYDFESDTCPHPASQSVAAPNEFTLADVSIDVSEVGAVRDALPVDFDLDGRIDLLVLGERGLAVFSPHSEASRDTAQFILPVTTELTRAMAVDFDRDAIESGTPPAPGICQDADPDVILFGPGGVEVYRNDKQDDGSRTLVVVEQSAGLNQVTGVRDAIPGDFDHDGDLDLALITASEVQIWSQSGGMQFVNASQRLQLPEDGLDATRLLAVDWDRDVDLDIVIVGPGRAGYFENLRHGEFRWRPFEDEFRHSDKTDVALLEADGNVSWDLAAADEQGVTLALTATPDRGVNRLLKQVNVTPDRLSTLVAGDWNNDGWTDLAGHSADGVVCFYGSGGGAFEKSSTVRIPAGDIATIRAADWDGDGDLDLIVVTSQGLRLLVNDASTRGGWLSVRVRGAEDPQSGRVNQYGVGSLVEVRHADHYQARMITGQVTHFGLGTSKSADSVRVLWTNGVPQVILQPQGNQPICERLTLKGSCPYVYTWTGDRFEFFTDLLWAAPLGLQFAEGVLAPSRPWEYLLVPGEAMVLKEGKYELRVTEELWEAAYFDQIELLAIDHPADVEVFSNEKVGPAEIAEFRVHTVQQRRLPVAARDQQGRDVLDQVRARDGVFLRAFDAEFRQGLTESHYLELDLGPLNSPKQITLFLTGWIYPTDTSLNIALDSDPRLEGPRPPSLSVPDANGKWQIVRPFMGFPGGKTKTIAIDLSDVFLAEDYRLRIETSHEIYWDEAFFTIDEPQSPVRVTPLTLSAAELHFRGFSAARPQRANSPETYDYDSVTTAPKWPPMAGNFTRYGDVVELLQASDDRLVLMSSGDELRLQFEPPPGELPPGWKRDFFLHNVGWDKDADLHTIYGQTVEPLPFRAMSSYPYPADEHPENESLRRLDQQRYHTRRQRFADFWQRSLDH